MRQESPDLIRHYWRAKSLRPGSYFAASVDGAPISNVQQYIEQQNHPTQPLDPSHHHPKDSALRQKSVAVAQQFTPVGRRPAAHVVRSPCRHPSDSGRDR
ncbi:hypothetical protein GCM10023223_03220 [Stackebrandtia albiflava]